MSYVPTAVKRKEGDNNAAPTCKLRGFKVRGTFLFSFLL